MTPASERVDSRKERLDYRSLELGFKTKSKNASSTGSPRTDNAFPCDGREGETEGVACVWSLVVWMSVCFSADAVVARSRRTSAGGIRAPFAPGTLSARHNAPSGRSEDEIPADSAFTRALNYLPMQPQSIRAHQN